MVFLTYSEVYYILSNVAVSLLYVLINISIKTVHIWLCYNHIQ